MEALLHLFVVAVPEIKALVPKATQEIHFVDLRKELEKVIYFTNVVSCWPPEDRQPTVKEMQACWPRLAEELYTLDPVLIIALGKVAMRGLLKYTGSMEGARGGLFTLSLQGEVFDVPYPVLAAYHPSFVSRIGDFSAKTGVCATWYRDLAKALGIVDNINHRVFGDPILNRLGGK